MSYISSYCSATMRRSAFLALAGLLLLSRSAVPVPQFRHDAYIWQRVWTPAVTAAVERSAPFIQGWHVLVAEIDPSGGIGRAAPDWAMLARMGKPVTAVIRIDGRLDERRVPDVVAFVGAIARPGQPIDRIEIDYDCPTARLVQYAGFLNAIRQALPPAETLIITSLPDWLGSPALPEVIAQADMVVLQVHAVDDPHRGLFDRSRALDWAEAMGRRSTKPFLVALPAYQLRVGWADGRLASVTGEAPTLAVPTGQELAAGPAAVEALIRDLAAAEPDHLAGLVWFRMPTDADRRSWSFATWRAVIANKQLEGGPQVRTVPSEIAGTRDILLVNEGSADAPMPLLVPVPDHCRSADGAGGYALDHGALALEGDHLIGAGRTITIGWARCDEAGVPDGG